jgi:hypothetical protein
MLRGLAVASAGAVALLAAGQACAHDWYPTECCDELDCYPLRSGTVRFTVDGWHILQTGEVIPPDDSRIRFSPDRRFHRCRVDFWETRSATRCLFVPLPDS